MGFDLTITMTRDRVGGLVKQTEVKNTRGGRIVLEDHSVITSDIIYVLRWNKSQKNII
jgi:hypothetical protein